MGRKKKQRFAKKGLPPGALIYTGDREARPSELTSLWYNEQECRSQEQYLPELQHKHGGTLWIDVRNLSDVAFIERVGNDFGMHPLALEDVLNTQQRAKSDDYDDALFVVMPNLRLDAEQFELRHEQVAFYVGATFLVSFQEDPDDTFQSVRNRVMERLGKIRRKGSDYLLHALMDTIVDQYYTVMDDLDAMVLDVEAELYSQGATPSCKAKMFQLKHLANQFRYRMLPLRDAVLRLYRTDIGNIEESNRPYFRDLADHVAQLLDSTENFRELIANLEALYQAEISNKMNNVMKLLTVISTIFIPLSFIAGVYGMNFEHMPELHWRYGYFFVLGFMLLAMIGMLIYFKRKKWM